MNLEVLKYCATVLFLVIYIFKMSNITDLLLQLATVNDSLIICSLGHFQCFYMYINFCCIICILITWMYAPDNRDFF